MKVYIVKYDHFSGDNPIGVYTDEKVAIRVSEAHGGAEVIQIFEMELDNHIDLLRNGYDCYMYYLDWLGIEGAPKCAYIKPYIERAEENLLPIIRQEGRAIWAEVWSKDSVEATKVLIEYLINYKPTKTTLANG